jgi:hypothetical protein
VENPSSFVVLLFSWRVKMAPAVEINETFISSFRLILGTKSLTENSHGK